MLNNLLKESIVKKIIQLYENKNDIKAIVRKLNDNYTFQKEIEISKPLFGYMGGKTKLTPQILKYLPDHQVYVEPFFGSGALMFGKGYKRVSNQADYREVINDLDNNVTNFYKQLRNNTQGLIEYISLMEYSKQLNSETKTKNEEKNKIKKACNFFFNIYSSFAGSLNSGFAYSKSGENKFSTLNNKTLLLNSYAKRLKNCYIFNTDYSKIIEKFDSEESFFYLDPPYQNTTKYTVNKNNNDLNYDKLAVDIKNIKGKWILSHYRDTFIDDNFSGYKIVELIHSCSIQKTNGEKRKGQNVKECIVMNFDIENTKMYFDKDNGKQLNLFY